MLRVSYVTELYGYKLSLVAVCLIVFSDHFLSYVFQISHVSQFLLLSPLLLGPQSLAIDTLDLFQQTLLLIPLLL